MVSIPIDKNISQEKCFPRDPTKAMAKCTRNVQPITRPIVLESTGWFANTMRIAANPHHAIVVRCQAKRSVRIVN